jgi:hypothetical protein
LVYIVAQHADRDDQCADNQKQQIAIYSHQ